MKPVVARPMKWLARLLVLALLIGATDVAGTERTGKSHTDSPREMGSESARDADDGSSGVAMECHEHGASNLGSMPGHGRERGPVRDSEKHECCGAGHEVALPTVEWQADALPVCLGVMELERVQSGVDEPVAVVMDGSGGWKISPLRI